MCKKCDRERIEKEFHDRKAENISRPDFLYSWGLLEEANRYMYELLGNVQNKLILDLGCGEGYHAVRLAKEGAFVCAVDLSEGMVARTRELVEQLGLANRVEVLQMSAHNLQFNEATFDLVFGHSVLHHTDLKLTRREVHRVLKPGGKGIFLEPLGHNPVINMFRRMTPRRRSPDEKPLRIEDVVFFAEPFTMFRRREFVLLALGALFLTPFKSKTVFEKVFSYLSRMDHFFFTRWPYLGRHAWVIVFEVVK